ncbi:MAG TPA: CsbD family protein [Acidimicrobiales bacterium]|nr:CsbD family protein [Acidimicrobiales bacterium]
MSTEDKIQNKAQDIKGNVKEAAGKATGNERLEGEGKGDQVASQAKGVGEKIKDTGSALKDAVTD